MLRRSPPIFAIVALLTVACMVARSMAADMDGVIMQHGKVMTMKAGKALDTMTTNMTMSNGATVAPDGTVRLPGGEEVHMKDGQMMIMDGTIMDGGKPKPMMKPKGMEVDD